MSVSKLLEAAGGGLFVVVITFVGIRLLLLAKRNRAMPELLLGIAFLAGGSLGAAFEVAGQRGVDLPIETAGALMFAGKILGGLGLTVYNLFVWRVFRPESSWAGALFLVLLVATVVAVTGLWWDGAFEGGPLFGRFFWLEFVARMTSPLWLVGEALHYHGQMRRRLALGLADPVVTDRFRLWALGASCSVLTLATSVSPVILPPDHPLASVNILVLAGSGIASCFWYWMAFFPTAGYLARVRARAEALKPA